MVMSKKLILPFISTSDVNFRFGNELNSDNLSLMSADFSSQIFRMSSKYPKYPSILYSSRIGMKKTYNFV